jgi:hypothetical protein
MSQVSALSRLRPGAANTGEMLPIAEIMPRVRLTSDRPLSENRYRRSFIGDCGINFDISEKHSFHPNVYFAVYWYFAVLSGPTFFRQEALIPATTIEQSAQPYAQDSKIF